MLMVYKYYYRISSKYIQVKKKINVVCQYYLNKNGKIRNKQKCDRYTQIGTKTNNDFIRVKSCNIYYLKIFNLILYAVNKGKRNEVKLRTLQNFR